MPISLAIIACAFGLRSGLDHVVVGMRTPVYVAELKVLWQ